AAPETESHAVGALVPAAAKVPARRNPYGQLGPYGASPDVPGDFGLILLGYWRILNKRKWLILGIAGAFVVLGTVRTLMTTPLYSATVRLQIERNVAKIV